jgi:hypothetical protein
VDAQLALDPTAIAAVAILLAVLSFVFIIVLWAKLSGMKKRYRQMMNGSGSVNVEEWLINIQEKLNQAMQKGKTAEEAVGQIREDMKRMKSRVEVQRYNGFNQMGSDLSFSLAILDDSKDGVVLTGIHSREQTYIYAKPIDKGQSKYTLSPEEQQVIDRAFAKQS